MYFIFLNDCVAVAMVAAPITVTLNVKNMRANFVDFDKTTPTVTLDPDDGTSDEEGRNRSRLTIGDRKGVKWQTYCFNRF